ncbi:unnamed protein product [Scytosiphon promiscuus]
MNSALDKLYSELLHQADEDPVEEITDAEKAKRFLVEKQITIEKLKEISLRKLEEDERRMEIARMRELERKRQAAIEKRINQERREKELIREIENNTMRFWKRDVTGKRRETGVLYSGESKRKGDAWVPHGYGEYRIHGEIIYDGQFYDGAMHGSGRLLLDNGDIWAGQFWKDMVQGLGTIISEDNSKRKAIYWRDRRVCFLDELVPGCRLQLLSDEFVRDGGGEAAVVSATHREGMLRHRKGRKADSFGAEKLLRLDAERFRLLRHKPRVIPLDAIIGSTAYGLLYDYDKDQANPQTTVYRENFYYPDLWAGREKAKQEKQAELDLEMKRSQILSRRQVERDKQAAADKAADVAKGLEEERLRQKEVQRLDAEDGEKGKEALQTAQAAAAAKKQKHKDLSRSPPRDGR